MNVQVLTDISGFDALQDEWDELLNRAVVPSAFLTYSWQRTWWEHLDSGDLFLIVLRDDAGQLVGIAPFFREVVSKKRRRLTLIGCVDVSDYLDVIVDRLCADEVYRALWEFLAGPEAPEWDVLNLCNLPDASPTYRLLGDLARSQGYLATVTVDDVCPVITLPETWEDYLAMLTKKQRHEIRRKMRRAEEAAEVRWYAVEGGDTLADDIESFMDFHQQSTAEKEGFWDQPMKSFFGAVLTRYAQEGWLKLYFIEFDGVRAATLLCFDYCDEILVYNSGYDPEQFYHLSPGIILTGYCIQHAIQLGRTRLDFLRGDEVYKFRFGAISEPVHRLCVQRDSA